MIHTNTVAPASSLQQQASTAHGRRPRTLHDRRKNDTHALEPSTPELQSSRSDLRSNALLVVQKLFVLLARGIPARGDLLAGVVFGQAVLAAVASLAKAAVTDDPH